MSNNFESPSSTQSDWHGQYPLPLPGDGNTSSQPYSHGVNSVDGLLPGRHHRSTHASGNLRGLGKAARPEESSPSPSLNFLRGPDTHGLRQPDLLIQSTSGQPETQGDVYAHKEAASVGGASPNSKDDVLVSSTILNPPCLVSSASHASRFIAARSDNEPASRAETRERALDDEPDAGGDEEEASDHALTAAERMAQRRKMKRFRLTHQQTRFLMSEFATQPHPDAAHRERLSREIPGLSPRQVQVWFQNRRAKIKRLTPDDRDRMVKMRAVPDDFDSVQALHSPYGAVQGLGPALASAIDFGGHPYAGSMMRPIMMEDRRSGGSGPSLGLSFNATGAPANPDTLSPMSQAPIDRYAYSAHLSTPVSAASRASDPFGRQGDLDTGMQIQQTRPLQPPQFREIMSRPQPGNLQSSLRSRMPWRADPISYAAYREGSGGPPPQIPGRQQPAYQLGQINNQPAGTLGAYDTSSYSGNTSASSLRSPTHLNYQLFPSPNLHHSAPGNARLQATPAPSPLGLGLRSPASTEPGAQAGLHPPRSGGAAAQPHCTAPTSYAANPTAPPTDFQPPRAPAFPAPGAAEYPPRPFQAAGPAVPARAGPASSLPVGGEQARAGGKRKRSSAAESPRAGAGHGTHGQ